MVLLSRSSVDRKVSWSLLNKEKPVWLRSPEDVSADEYATFYKSLSGDWEDLLLMVHSQFLRMCLVLPLLVVLMSYCFKSWSIGLSFCFDSAGSFRSIKIYARRVFIMDDCRKIVPQWLSFLSGC
jgi:molecular chaperone HtpG